MDAPAHENPPAARAGEQAARRRGPVRRCAAWYRRHVWPATAVIVLLVLVAGLVALQVAVRDRVGDGVTVAGAALGGQTQGEAAATIEQALAPAWSSITLRTPAGPKTVSGEELGVTLDARATAAAAYALGRHELPLGVTLWLPGGGGEVAPVLRVDPARFEEGLEAVREAVERPATDARLQLDGDAVSVVPAREGSGVDAVALQRAILAALAAGEAYSGEVPMAPVAPRVTTADAEARVDLAARYVAQPITLRLRERSVVLTPARIAGMLSVNTGDDADSYPLTFANARARAELHRLFGWAETPPVDAQVVPRPDGGIDVTQSSDGEVLDMTILLEDLTDAAQEGGLRTVFVALKPAPPSLSTEDVQSSGLARVGSQFVTYFDPRNEARAGNIALAARLVDGATVAPGATFSLNAAMGPRTANRGFDYAPVIAGDGVLRQGVGGGICQYATTLFNAVFFAGLPVVERHAHSLYIAHYPTGRDATVAWGALDFKFRNDTGKTLTVRSWVEAGALTVAVVGKTGREVSFTTSDFYDITKPAHTRGDPRVISDGDLGAGIVRWEKGTDGRSVKVVRTVRDPDGTVRFRDTYVSVYDPMDWIKRVGTG